MSKKNSLQVYIISILIFGFLGTSIISYFVSRSAIRKQITGKQLPLTSDNVYSEVQNDLLKPIFISSLMASDTFLRDWVLDEEKDVKKIKKYLNEIKAQYGVFSSFFVSENTQNYYYADGILKKVSPDEKRDAWYYRVKDMFDDYEINVDIDMANNDYLTIFINYKVFDYNKNYIGVTGVGLQVDKVNKVIANYQRRYNSRIHFIDKNGNIKLSGTKEINTPYHSDISKYEKSDINSYNINTFSYKENGENILVNIRYIPEFNWYLVVEQSDKDDTKALLNTFMFNSIITFLISAGIILITSTHWQKLQQQLVEAASTDKLTGACNRQAFDIEINKLMRKSQKTKSGFSFMIFDIDNFKYVNDSFGHLAGDEVIKTIAELLFSHINDKFSIFRWGGDEFVILFKTSSLNESYRIAEELRINISKNEKLSKMKVSISSGITDYKLGESIDSLLKRADELMYEAKEKGKNHTVKG